MNLHKKADQISKSERRSWVNNQIKIQVPFPKRSHFTFHKLSRVATRVIIVRLLQAFAL